MGAGLVGLLFLYPSLPFPLKNFTKTFASLALLARSKILSLFSMYCFLFVVPLSLLL